MNQAIETTEVNHIQVVRAGTEGPNILFLHDSGQPPVGMKRQIGQLAEAGRVIAPNLFDTVSVLRSKGIVPTFEDMVHAFDQLDLIDRRYKTGIVAVSLGAGFAWEYAAQKPQAVDWITTGSPLGYPLHRSLFGWFAEFIRVSRQTSSIPDVIRKTDEGTILIRRQFRKDPRSVFDVFVLAMNMDSRGQMRNIQSHVDLLWGRNDHFTPIWTGKKMQELLPHARLDEVSDYYHYWYQFEPEKLTKPAIEKVQTSK